MNRHEESLQRQYQLLMSVDNEALRTLVRFIIEAAEDDDRLLGLKLPDIKDPSETKGDDTPQQRATMRLTGDVKQADDAKSKLDSKRKSTGRQSIRKGKDPEVDFATMFDSGSERKFRNSARNIMTKLDRILQRDVINPREVIPLIKKLNSNPYMNKDASIAARKARSPRINDIMRDIEIASQKDDDDQQPAELKDLIKTLVTAQRDILDSANIGINTGDEHKKQKEKKIRS